MICGPDGQSVVAVRKQTCQYVTGVDAVKSAATAPKQTATVQHVLIGENYD